MNQKQAIAILAVYLDLGGDLDMTYVRPDAVTRAVTVLNEQYMEPIRAFHSKWNHRSTDYGSQRHPS